MKSLFKSRFKFRKNPILIHYGQNLEKYSFIQNNHYFNNKYNNRNQNLQNKTQIQQSNLFDQSVKNSLNNYYENLYKYQPQLKQIHQYDFTKDNLKQLNNFLKQPNPSLSININNRKSYNNNTLLTHLIPLNHLTTSYVQLSQSLYSSLTPTTSHHLPHIINHSISHNIITIKLWQKIFSYIGYHYTKQSNIQKRSIYLASINDYIKKFRFSFQTNRIQQYKFMYPQAYLNDLGSFREFIKVIQCQDDYWKQTDSNDIERKKWEILESKISLILKSGKKVDLNIIYLRQLFAKRINQMIKICQKYQQYHPNNNISHQQLHSRLLYKIYFIYSYLNYSNNNFYQKIQKKYYQYLRNIFKTYHNKSYKQKQFLSKQLIRLLSIWKLNQRSNIELHNQIIKPFLQQLIQNEQMIQYYSNIGINLLTSGVEDIQLIEKIVGRLDRNKMANNININGYNNNQDNNNKSYNLNSRNYNNIKKQDQFQHMLKHYLNIKKNTKLYNSSYEKCSHYQNPSILKHFKQNNIQIYSNCLILQQNINKNKNFIKNNNKNIINNNNNNNKKSTKKHHQYHDTQNFWIKLLKSIFQPKYQILQNINICNYQIDILLIYQNNLIAIEIQGNHYKKKINKKNNEKQNNNLIESNTNNNNGKKKIRQLILQKYSIKILKIHCQEEKSLYLMQTRNLQQGKKYIISKIQKQLNLKINIQNK